MIIMMMMMIIVVVVHHDSVVALAANNLTYILFMFVIFRESMKNLKLQQKHS